MMIMVRTARYMSFALGLGALVTVSAAKPAQGQQPQNPTTRSAEASRPELEAMLAAAQHDSTQGSAEDQDRRLRNISNLRDRLTNGDFSVGDRVYVSVQGQPTLTDTMTVREGQILHLANLGDVSLHGVLRSELQGQVYAAVSKYLRDPVVHTGSLVRISVLGSVTRPGFYAVPADMLISDAIMHAGGLGNNADVSRTTVSRGGTIVWQEKDVANAIRNGATLDQMSLRPGDQIAVGTKGSNMFLTLILPVTGAIVGIATGVILITRH